MMLDGEEQKHYQEQSEETEMSSPWIYELGLVPTEAMVRGLLTELRALCPAAVLLQEARSKREMFSTHI